VATVLGAGTAVPGAEPALVLTTVLGSEPTVACWAELELVEHTHSAVTTAKASKRIFVLVPSSAAGRGAACAYRLPHRCPISVSKTPDPPLREIENRYTLANLRLGFERAMAEKLIAARPIEPLLQLLNGAFCDAAMFVARAKDPRATLRVTLAEFRLMFDAVVSRRPVTLE
jgi:hypothetical protein